MQCNKPLGKNKPFNSQVAIAMQGAKWQTLGTNLLRICRLITSRGSFSLLTRPELRNCWTPCLTQSVAFLRSTFPNGLLSPRVRLVCRGTFEVASRVQIPFRTSRRNVGLLLRRCRGQGPHLAMTGEPRGVSRVVAGVSSFDGEYSLPHVLAQGSPIFHSSPLAKMQRSQSRGHWFHPLPPRAK